MSCSFPGPVCSQGKLNPPEKWVLGEGGAKMNSITDVEGVKVGQTTDAEALTGCTVILTERGAAAGVDVRGSAPGTRETDLLRPGNLVEEVHAVLLTGGSAFGLDAASGVMAYLEERGFGFDVGVARVPIVPAAVLFDLGVGDPRRRPDRDMGYRACLAASSEPPAEGSFGAGTGATVGKLFGQRHAMKGGIGSWSTRLDSGVTVGAIVAVNAFGDVLDPTTGEILAGSRNPLTGKLVGTSEMMKRGREMGDFAATNTTIAVVATDAALTKAEANKVAQMAHNGLARSISPVHTMFDGDTVFCLSTGPRVSDVNIVGTVAAEVLAEAVKRAVLAAEGIPGIPSCRDLGTQNSPR